MTASLFSGYCGSCGRARIRRQGPSLVFECVGCEQPEVFCTCVPLPEWTEDIEETGAETAGPAFEEPPDLLAERPLFTVDGRMLRQAELGVELPRAQCNSCGCTDTTPCLPPCFWANPQGTLCSRCAMGGSDGLP